MGKLKPHPDLISRLVLVRNCERIGDLPGRECEQHGVYKVLSVVLVPIVEDNVAIAQLGLRPCPKHQANLGDVATKVEPELDSGGEVLEPVSPPSSNAFAKVKMLATDAVKTTAGNAAALANQVKAPFASKNVIATPWAYKSSNVSKI